MEPVTLSGVTELTPEQTAAVHGLTAAARAADRAAPLSGQFLLDLRPGSGALHHLAYAGDGLAGYAQLSPADGQAPGPPAPPAAELVVAPAQRRRGTGSALLAALPPEVRVWAHGDVPGAAEFARATGLHVVRELLRMHRGLGAGGPDLDEAVVPDALTVRPFEPGRDEHAWLAANAAAFAHHPEQASLTLGDLEQRMGEPWFDPKGFILVVPHGQPDVVAAFHWTKVHPAGDEGPEPVGEVYVVGVDPAYQGSGLGRPLTLLGLRHLQDQGVEGVFLYSDGDNAAALRTYDRLGFTTVATDRMYSHAVHSGVRP